MSEAERYVIRNVKRLSCKCCGKVHEFLSSAAPDADCSTPIAVSSEYRRFDVLAGMGEAVPLADAGVAVYADWPS